MPREISQMSNLSSVEQIQVWMCVGEFPRMLEKVWKWPLEEPWVFKAIILFSHPAVFSLGYLKEASAIRNTKLLGL